MTEEAFTDEDSEHPRSDRFKARREMINTMIRMGAAPTPVQFDTPRGAINASKLKELGRTLIKRDGEKFVQIGQQFDRPPGTGKISGLVEETRKRKLQNSEVEETLDAIAANISEIDKLIDEFHTGGFKVVGKTLCDDEISYPRFIDRTKDEK